MNSEAKAILASAMDRLLFGRFVRFTRYEWLAYGVLLRAYAHLDGGVDLSKLTSCSQQLHEELQ